MECPLRFSRGCPPPPPPPPIRTTTSSLIPLHMPPQNLGPHRQAAPQPIKTPTSTYVSILLTWQPDTSSWVLTAPTHGHHQGLRPRPLCQSQTTPLTAPTHDHHQGLCLLCQSHSQATPPYCPNTWPPPGATGPVPYVNHIHRPRPSLPQHMATTRGYRPRPLCQSQTTPLTAPNTWPPPWAQATPLMSIQDHAPHFLNTWPPPGALPLMLITFTGHAPSLPQHMADTRGYRPHPLCQSQTTPPHCPQHMATTRGYMPRPLCQSQTTPPQCSNKLSPPGDTGPAPYVNHRPNSLTAPTHGHHRELHPHVNHLPLPSCQS